MRTSGRWFGALALTLLLALSGCGKSGNGASTPGAAPGFQGVDITGVTYDMAGLGIAVLLADRVDPVLAGLPAWRASAACLWTAPVVMVAEPEVPEMLLLPAPSEISSL